LLPELGAERFQSVEMESESTAVRDEEKRGRRKMRLGGSSYIT
jgi:hypothetical protein